MSIAYFETEIRMLKVKIADLERRLSNLEEIADLPQGGRIELNEVPEE